MRAQNSIGTPGRDGLYFSVTSMAVDDNRKLGKAVCDKDGYYKDVPVAVLGTVTRNKTQYDTAEFIKQLTSDESSFNKRLTEGCLFSEYGHPFVDLNSPAGMTRLLHLEPQKESNHIRSVSVRNLPDLKLDIITMDTKASGPYGKYFDDAMLDPTRNIAFSLRGVSKATFDRRTGVTFKKLVSLVTFDSGVASGGFREASKRYMSATEDLQFESHELLNKEIAPDELMLVRSIAMESFSNSELNDLMKSHKVVIGTVEIGYVDPLTKTIHEMETGERRGLFHSFSKVKGR